MYNDYFNVQVGSNGEISTLKLTGDTYPTNYVLNSSNAPNLNTSDHQWFGELMFKYRLSSGSWQTALTQSSGDVRMQSNNKNTVTVTYLNSSNTNGIKNFKVIETYSLVDDSLQWSIQLTNTSSQTLEIGDLGMPLPFNEIWPGGTVYEERVLYHANIAYSNSYVYVTRPSGVGPLLLMIPDASTGAGWEYRDRWVKSEHNGSSWASNDSWPDGLQVYYIHSNVIKSTNRGYLSNTSLILAPGQSKTYTFKLFKAADQKAMKEKLYTEGLIDVNVVPGMIVPANQTAKFDLHTSQKINSVTAQYSGETTITSLGTVNTDHKIYSLKMNHLGQNNITINYGSGEKTVLQFYAIEPIDSALQRHATFMVNNTQWGATGDIRAYVFDDWMMDTKSKRNNFSGYMGWGDDWGLTHAQFLAEKNAQSPIAAEITALDNYLEYCVWNNVMVPSTYQVHDWLNTPHYTDDLYRAFAYPHVANTYYGMYKIVRFYPSFISYKNPATTYLLRAYHVMHNGMAMSTGTGLMGESSVPEIIAALKKEGYPTEANTLVNDCSNKYNDYRSQAYPYGSEYIYDNTGEESGYMVAKMNNNKTMMSKINEKTRASRGSQPLWYYYADPTSICGSGWWQFQYSAALIGYCMDDWTRYYSSVPEEDERMAYAAKIANLNCINSGQIDSAQANIGTVAWTYQASRGNYYEGSAESGTLHNGWRQMAGEADLGLWGAIRILSADVSVDPIFGLYGYGCEAVKNGESYVITPKDGINKRLNLITEKLYIELDRDQYTSAAVAAAKNYIELTLKNQYTAAAHTTTLSIYGLAPGSYDVLADKTVVSGFTAAANAKTTINLNIGTHETYNIRITKGSALPEVVAKYTFDNTAEDSSGNNKTAMLNGSASYAKGMSGQALMLDGSGGYASLPEGIVSNLNDFTISAWINARKADTWTRVFDFGTGTDKYMFLTLNAGSYPRFAITTGGNDSEQTIDGTSAFPTGTWHHVAVTLSGTSGTLYIDGSAAASNANMTLTPLSLGSTNQNYIGKSQWSDPYLDGSVDDFRIYSRALSPSEIRSLYGNNSKPEVTAPPSWIHSFYKKCVMINGIPICSTSAVPDQALLNACEILDAQLKKIKTDKPAVLQKMLENQVYAIIIGLNETNDMHPSWSGSSDPSWPRRGGGGNPTTVLEEDCIVPSDDTWRQNFCGLVHEFAHTLLTYGIGDAGLAGADTATYNAIVTAYNHAIDANKYTESDYDRSNYHEYFTGQSCRWFNANPTDLNVPNASGKSDRDQLKEYDPEMYHILSTLYGDYKLPKPWN